MDSNKNTALDALIGELLGDVGKLHDEVKELREEIPQVREDVGNLLPDMLRDAAKALGDVSVSLGKQIDDYATTSTRAATETAKLSIGKAAEAAASRAVEAAMTRRFDDLASRLQGTIVSLEHGTATARAAIVWSWREKAAAFAATVTLAVALSVGLNHVLPSSNSAPLTAALTDEQKADMEGGRMMRLIYNSLTPKEQTHIKQLVAATPTHQR